MGKTTIRDIAQTAQVSTATVDRALNGRAGVSAANRQRVLEAAKRLGYLPLEGMMPLPTRPAHLEFLIPVGRSSFMHALRDAITSFAASLPLVASCRIVPLDGIGPEALVAALDRVGERTSGVGVIAVDHPMTRHAVRQVCEAGLRVVTIASDIPSAPRSAYIGVDNRVAGRTAAHVMGMTARDVVGQVALFLGSKAFHGHQEREFGFRALLDAEYPGLSILPAIETGEDSDRARRAMAELLRTTDDLVGVYCIGSGRTGIAEALRGTAAPRPFVVLHELTDNSRAWLAEGLVDMVIDQNARAVGEQAVIRLLGSIAAGAALLTLKDIDARLVFRENIPLQ